MRISWVPSKNLGGFCDVAARAGSNLDHQHADQILADKGTHTAASMALH